MPVSLGSLYDKVNHTEPGILRALVRLFDAALQQSENVVGQHRDHEAQQRRPGVAETGHLAVEHAF